MATPGVQTAPRRRCGPDLEWRIPEAGIVPAARRLEGFMLCALCGSVGRMRTSPDDGERTRRGSVGPGPESDFESCASCGRPLAVPAAEGVVETLSQLARFGLTGQVILTRKRA